MSDRSSNLDATRGSNPQSTPRGKIEQGGYYLRECRCPCNIRCDSGDPADITCLRISFKMPLYRVPNVTRSPISVFQKITSVLGLRNGRRFRTTRAQYGKYGTTGSIPTARIRTADRKASDSVGPSATRIQGPTRSRRPVLYLACRDIPPEFRGSLPSTNRQPPVLVRRHAGRNVSPTS